MVPSFAGQQLPGIPNSLQLACFSHLASGSCSATSVQQDSMVPSFAGQQFPGNAAQPGLLEHFAVELTSTGSSQQLSMLPSAAGQHAPATAPIATHPTWAVHIASVLLPTSAAVVLPAGVLVVVTVVESEVVSSADVVEGTLPGHMWNSVVETICVGSTLGTSFGTEEGTSFGT
eukprot:CAMPEP_0204416648 /NCGR_PEP_ID=MMETSP0470-20130426/26313_1 /ASSEMBLY_ACC=CAM_ASM_000385 /TAXON_ID=2969 /ORGANISM="Oxyrrhis marina" /LENGTH=173 /DNA_ID=CAMNT_0051413159 /DNA_START=412 /DNA_END=929 /DNA_ORIENTATION=+